MKYRITYLNNTLKEPEIIDNCTSIQPRDLYTLLINVNGSFKLFYDVYSIEAYCPDKFILFNLKLSPVSYR